MQTLTKKDVCARLGIALSTLNNKIDPKSPWHDPTFPEKIMIGRAVRFSEAQLIAWIEKQSDKSARSVPARKQSSEVVETAGCPSVIGLAAKDEGGEMRAYPPVAKVPKTAAPTLAARKGSPRSESSSLKDESVEDAFPALDAPDMNALTSEVSGVTVRELHIDSPPPMSVWDMIQLSRGINPPPGLHPEWASTINSMLKNIAGSGTTASQSGAFSTQEVHDLLNPSEAASAALDGIDLHSHNTVGALLTAVLYDLPEQCGRLVRIADAVGVQVPAAELLRLEREKLFGLYERNLTRTGGGVPTWRRFGDRMKIVRE